MTYPFSHCLTLLTDVEEFPQIALLNSASPLDLFDSCSCECFQAKAASLIAGLYPVISKF